MYPLVYVSSKENEFHLSLDFNSFLPVPQAIGYKALVVEFASTFWKRSRKLQASVLMCKAKEKGG